MSEPRDYYDVLGLSREAGEDEIRRAYRKLALKFHPDRNQGDDTAEGKFKEATEAFSILSDAEKKAAYDRFGHAGVKGGGGFDVNSAGVGDIFSHFQDIFSDFFGGGGGGRSRGARGSDVRVQATVSLADAMTGAKREVSIRGQAPCEDCGGNGCAKGSSPETCLQCGGQGQVTTQRGFMMFSSHCPRCKGQGQVIKNPCDGCDGSGLTSKVRKVNVSFPAGIDSGQRLRVPGQGMPGPGGAPSGDLYVDVEMEADDTFERDGNDLILRQTLSYAEATFGTNRDILLPNEDDVAVKIPAGTQPGTVLSARNKGMPDVSGRSGRGALHVVVEVAVPKKLSRKAKKLLQELDKELQA